MFYTYILYSKSVDRYYTGHASDLDLRVERHNDGWSRSTKNGIPWKPVYCRSFKTKSEAMKWENFIKRQKSRSFIERLTTSSENELNSTDQ